MWYKDGVWCDAESDSDGDGLPDFMEMLLGTDINNADSDGDGLPDGFEYLMIGTDPLKADSDGNGVNDGAEDDDGDGLTNLQEYTLGTNPMSSDSDGDGLSDGDEVNTYHTDPLKIDTDGDGLSDYNEITNGFDPLVYNSSFDIELSCEGENVTASVNINGLNGEQAESLQIEPVDNYILLDNRIPGYIDSAFDFSVTGDFETATISFEFDPVLLENENFVPRIYYFNEETQYLEELPNQVVQGNVVSVETTHFSKYILLNKNDYKEVWYQDIRKPSQVNNSMDIVFVTDVSMSMDWNDPNWIRKVVINDFVDKLTENDRSALVSFRKYAESNKSLSNNHYETKIAVNSLVNDNGRNSMSGTNGSDGLNKALLMFDSLNNAKSIVFITDGQDTLVSFNYEEIIQYANSKNVTIYTIGLGDGIDETQLRNIASKTGGKYYKAEIAEDLIEDFTTIFDENVDYFTDSNNDGISDYYTKLICEGKLPGGTGMNLFEGISFEALQANDDYDGDGLKNGEEAIISFNEQDNSPYICYVSNPCKKDSDYDKYNDYVEVNVYNSNPLVSDVKFYQLKNKYISVEGSYGGDQDWFPNNVIDSQDCIIHECGCGLISAADILLYLSMANSKYKTDVTDIIEFDSLGNITMDSYMEYIRFLESNYFTVSPDFGIMGPLIGSDLIHYSNDYGLNLTSTWKGTDRLLPVIFNAIKYPKGMAIHFIDALYQWYCTENYSDEFILPTIIEMLENDIPITLSVGPTWEYLLAADDEKDEIAKRVKLDLYQPDTNSSEPYAFESINETFDHYVTVTGLLIDNVLNRTMIRVSSWGTEYYIDYEEYLNYVVNKDSFIFSNVLYIDKG